MGSDALYFSFSSDAITSSLLAFRAFKISRAPCEANLRAHPSPIPLEAPVISTVLFMILDFLQRYNIFREGCIVICQMAGSGRIYSLQ